MTFEEERRNPEKPDQFFITAYGDGGFRVLGDRHEGSLIVTPDAVIAWPITQIDELETLEIEPLLDLVGRIDVLLVGTGDQHHFLPPSTYQALADAGISVDFMATGPACRTFNVLQSDGRNVAAALIANP